MGWIVSGPCQWEAGACRCGSVPDDDARGLGGVKEEHLPILKQNGHSPSIRRDNGHMSAGHEASFLPRAQRFGVAIGQPDDDSPGGDVERIEGTTRDIVAGAVGSRDQITVRVTARVAEDSVKTVEKPIGDRMFENLGLLVHLIP